MFHRTGGCYLVFRHGRGISGSMSEVWVHIDPNSLAKRTILLFQHLPPFFLLTLLPSFSPSLSLSSQSSRPQGAEIRNAKWPLLLAIKVGIPALPCSNPNMPELSSASQLKASEAALMGSHKSLHVVSLAFVARPLTTGQVGNIITLCQLGHH